MAFLISFPGRAVSAPVSRTSTRTGKPFVTFTMAYNNQYTAAEGQVVTETTYYDIIVNSENVGKSMLANIQKGSLVNLQSLRPPEIKAEVYEKKEGGKAVRAKTSFIDPILTFERTSTAQTKNGETLLGDDDEIEVVESVQREVRDAEAAPVAKAAPATATRRTGRPAAATRAVTKPAEMSGEDAMSVD